MRRFEFKTVLTGRGHFNPLFLGLYIDIIPSPMMRLHTLILIYFSIQPLVDVLKGPEDGRVFSPVEMWLDAIDLLFGT